MVAAVATSAAVNPYSTALAPRSLSGTGNWKIGFFIMAAPV